LTNFLRLLQLSTFQITWVFLGGKSTRYFRLSQMPAVYHASPLGRLSGWRRKTSWRGLKHVRGRKLNELALSLIHISEPTRLGMISYAVFCLKKKKKQKQKNAK